MLLPLHLNLALGATPFIPPSGQAAILSAESHSLAPFLGSQGADQLAAAIRSAKDESMGTGLLAKQTRAPAWASEVSTWRWVSQITTGNRTYIQSNPMQRISAIEGESVTIRSRPVDVDENTVFKKDVESILVNVFDTSSPDPSAPIFSADLPVNVYMFDVLQVTAGWRADVEGFTFSYPLPADVLIEGGRVYKIEVVFRTFNAGPRTLIHFVETVPLNTLRTNLGS